MDELIKIMIIDKHYLSRKGLIKLLKDEKNIIVVGEAKDGEELLQNYFDILPDILLMDLNTQSFDSPTIIKSIIEKDNSVKIVCITSQIDEKLIYQILNIGIDGLIDKNMTEDEFLYALRQVNSGESYFSTSMLRLQKRMNERKSEFNNQHNSEPLVYHTFREIQILGFIKEGYKSSDIAKELGLSKRTVDNYRYKLLQKLNIHSLPELIKYAMTVTLN